MDTSFSFVNIILTFFNVCATIALVWVTVQYTKATKRIAYLEEERKVWDVQPVIVPVTRFVRTQSTSGYSQGFNMDFVALGIKNIGRGVAILEEFNAELKESFEKESDQYALPLYLNLNEEFIYTKLKIQPASLIMVKNVSFYLFKWSFEAKFTDIHGNWYFASYQNGQIRNGKLLSK